MYLFAGVSRRKIRKLEILQRRNSFSRKSSLDKELYWGQIRGVFLKQRDVIYKLTGNFEKLIINII